MKTNYLKISHQIPILCVALLATNALAVEPELLFSFHYDGTTSTDGEDVRGHLIQGSDGNFYGTAYNGGDAYGLIFKITPSGALTKLAAFHGTNGANPAAGLTLGADGSFYGTTMHGGPGNAGTVFRVTTNGELTMLASFVGATNGAAPQAPLTLGPDENFYGTALAKAFRVSTNGILTGLANLPGFSTSALTLGNDGNFYGTTYTGGSQGLGTIFKLTTDGTLTTLVSFTGTNGSTPRASLTKGNDGSFYGTTQAGGVGGNAGTVFRVTTNGALTTLFTFGPASTYGLQPFAPLTRGPDGNFYGTTMLGGGGRGSAFKVTTNGTLTTLALFYYGSGPYDPQAALTLGSDGKLYGTTPRGGAYDDGTFYRITIPFQLDLSPDGTGGMFIRGSGPPATTYRLQRAASVTGTWINVATNTVPASGLIEFHETTPPPGHAFYRAAQP